MFAEDGEIFLSQAHNLGLAAVWHPYNGYVHALPRIVAALTYWVPLTAIPMVFTAIAIGCYLAAAALVLSNRLDWLLPSSWHRAVTFALLCLIPPNWEVYGNLANFVAVSGVALFLLALARDPQNRGGKIAEAIMAAPLAMTGPYSLLLMPLFWWRVLRNQSRHSVVLATTVTVCALLEYAVVAASGRNVAQGGFGLFARALVERMAGGWIFGQADVFLRPDNFAAVSTATVWLIAASAVTVSALRRVGVVLWLALFVLVGASTRAYGPEFVDESVLVSRQLLVPFAILVVMLVAAAIRSKPGATTIVAICVFAALGGVVSRGVFHPWPLQSNMAALDACTERVCTIPIYEPGWEISLISREPR